ncbi:MAG: tRNA (cytidine(34)-2'-O)-methyltransferase [Myxococcota bacterium]|nr:tRNA (cytidine(34)-2'-O)-methyltransferase [Myxococcota bacterium]
MKIVLVHPLIPPNTGSIGRLCAATNTPLVLIEPLGFSLEDRYLKRAGLDYWPWIDLTVTGDWRSVLTAGPPPWLFTSNVDRDFTTVKYQEGDPLVFGSETKGLPTEILDMWPERQVCLPMDNPKIRSLNLAQCAAVALYEARRQVRVELES